METSEKPTGRASDAARNGLLAAMVFLVALNLRPAIVAVGPLLENLGHDLGWGEGTQGLLAALPLLAFAAMSPLVRFVTARFGENMTVLGALAILAVGALVRSAGGPTLVWVGTAVIGCAIAVGNVLVPAIVKRDYPAHVSLASAVSSSCITAGSAAASLSAVLLASQWGGWRAALAFWAVPAVVVAALWGLRIVAERRRGRKETVATSVSKKAEGAATDTGKSLWRRPMTWWVTAFMGLQSAAFYTMTNWLPTLSTETGETAATAGRQLFVFQLLGVICGLFIPRLMQVRGNQVTAALVASLPMVVAGFGLIVTPNLTWVWACVAGCGQGAALVVALALIAMRGRSQSETVALSGIAQSLGYLIASIGPSLFGLFAEHTGGFTVSLAFFTALAALQCAVAFAVGREDANGLR